MGEHSRPRHLHRSVFDQARPPVVIPARPPSHGKPDPAAYPVKQDYRDALTASETANVADTYGQQIPATCGYCHRPLDDGESHVHAGQLNDPEIAQQRQEWADRVNAYNRAHADLFAAYQADAEAAWHAYQAAMTEAGARFDRAAAAALTEFGYRDAIVQAAAEVFGPRDLEDGPHA